MASTKEIPDSPEKQLKLATVNLPCSRILYIKCLDESSQQYSVVYYVPEKRKIMESSFHPANDQTKELSEIMHCLQNRHPKKRMFAFVNPSSGRKQGLQIFNKTIYRHLTAAGIEMEFEVTEKTGSKSLAEIACRLDMDSYDALVILGGDTSLTDILNGLWEKAAKPDLKDFNLPCFGLIPVGTGNGLANDWYGSNSIDAALAGILLGETKRTILTRVTSDSGTFDRLADVCLTYGWAVDVGCSMQEKNSESVASKIYECFRCLMFAHVEPFNASLSITFCDGNEPIESNLKLRDIFVIPYSLSKLSSESSEDSGASLMLTEANTGRGTFIKYYLKTLAQIIGGKRDFPEGYSQDGPLMFYSGNVDSIQLKVPEETNERTFKNFLMIDGDMHECDPQVKFECCRGCLPCFVLRL